MAPDIYEVKQFLRVDGAYDDSVILSLINSAKVELSLSGVKERDKDHKEFPLYETAVKITVARDYEDRGLAENDMRILNNIILKLKDFSVPGVINNETRI
jgi:uncharacterized phage protein (predicted DNA packaging)